METLAETPCRSEQAEILFDRVVVGVDGGDESLEAARQAARLVGPRGLLEVFAAVDAGAAAAAGFLATSVAADLERESAEGIRRALAIVGPAAASRIVTGRPAVALLRELEERDATLVALGTHEHSRLSEIMIGGVVGEVLHRAPCSVLVARRPRVAARFPRSIVAGSDGSPQSDAAIAVAHCLAERFDASLAVVTATGGKGIDGERVRRAAVVELPGDPVHALVAAAADADLLVVGRRGLHGLRALGSVSERVAHEAACSVLVVRGSS